MYITNKTLTSRRIYLPDASWPVQRLLVKSKSHFYPTQASVRQDIPLLMNDLFEFMGIKIA